METNRGFTIIEMLLVVAIIGILSSVTLMMLSPARDKARDASIIQEVNQARALAETFYNGTYDALESLPKVNGPENQNLKLLADDIMEQGGELTIRKSAARRATAYIMYSPLHQIIGKGEEAAREYYCVESGGRTAIVLHEPFGMSCIE